MASIEKPGRGAKANYKKSLIENVNKLLNNDRMVNQCVNELEKMQRDRQAQKD